MTPFCFSVFLSILHFLLPTDPDSEAKRVQDVLSGIEKPQVGLEYELKTSSEKCYWLMLSDKHYMMSFIGQRKVQAADVSTHKNNTT